MTTMKEAPASIPSGLEGGREGEREGGKEGEKEVEVSGLGEWKGGRAGGREGGREGGKASTNVPTAFRKEDRRREGGREGGRKKGREGRDVPARHVGDGAIEGNPSETHPSLHARVEVEDPRPCPLGETEGVVEGYEAIVLPGIFFRLQAEHGHPSLSKGGE